MSFAGAEIFVREHACVRAEIFFGHFLICAAERNFDFSAHVFDKKNISTIDIFTERSNIKENSALLQLAVHIYH